jgi:hypothetical protein
MTFGEKIEKNPHQKMWKKAGKTEREFVEMLAG